MPFGAAAACLALLVPPLAVPSRATEASTHRDWQVLRTADDTCLVTQTVLGRRTGARLLSVFLAPAGPDAVSLAFQVPNGVSLPDGIAFRHAAADRTGIGLEWQQCDAERCMAAGQISVTEFGRLLAGREITVGYRPLPESRLLNVPLSLLGLTAAWKAAAACR